MKIKTLVAAAVPFTKEETTKETGFPHHLCCLFGIFTLVGVHRKLQQEIFNLYYE
jgi:hypothetical protein